MDATFQLARIMDVGAVIAELFKQAAADAQLHASEVAALPRPRVRLVRRGAAIGAQALCDTEGLTTPYHYQYDAAGRLTDVTAGGGVEAHYTFDSNGNRLRKVSSARPDEGGTYDAQDRLISYGDATYTYNRARQLETVNKPSGTTTYSYDVFGALRSVQLPDGRRVEYEVDADHRRIGKKINSVRQYGLLYQSDLRPVIFPVRAEKGSCR